MKDCPAWFSTIGAMPGIVEASPNRYLEVFPDFPGKKLAAAICLMLVNYGSLGQMVRIGSFDWIKDLAIGSLHLACVYLSHSIKTQSGNQIF